MKFVISSSVLSSRMQTIGRVIVAKNNLPILDCFLFEVKDNQLTLTASDNETTLSTVMDLAEADANIRFAANAKTVQDAIKEIPDQPLEIYVNEKNMEVTVEYRNGKYNFMAQPADEYPVPMTPAEGSPELHIEAPRLLDNVGRALFATADDALRPVMNGIFFDIQTDSLTVVASDGQKLACSTSLGVTSPAAGSFIIHKKPSMLLKNILAKTEEVVTIAFDGRNAEIRTENYRMACRLIEGKYPNYRSVIPKDNPNVATVNREALIAALRRTLIFSSVVSSLIKLRIDNSKLTVSSSDLDFAMSAEESLLCDYAGAPLTIGFKGPFLLELLNNLSGEEVIIRLADGTRAGVIVPAEQKENEEVLMLLMPLMIND
ncbi:MAG: DNA polymerase III subunit beta [Alloprevotella sp.]|nr:DNA polymerase III subunit beta [Alloprevotella sp.]MBR1652060.1 DNA polymerase III subunit beta [Alloprevotella sp.]